ncbi:ABC transporter substrate-binding protein [Rugosimonospora africana]|uniref:ABC transporter substrate-binding protein n=1 Tax=Rugosimonospora africana TaxID=556532 RepID=A0A8J3QXU4_9ACTN|nr:ABC transporter substrate-binding protein [Rugosimonospora africana]GIH19395.1 ABC transporter substrate-binding protein [Rugosimonospora africana]
MSGHVVPTISGTALSRRSLLGLAAAGALASPVLAACSRGGAGGGGFAQVDVKVPDAYRKRDQKVVLWTSWNGSAGKVLSGLVDKFNQSQNDIYAQAQFQGDYFSATSKVTAALRAKSVPDIMAFGQTAWQIFFLNETLEDLTSYADNAFRSSFYDNLFGAGLIKDKLYWISFARSTPIMYYNKDLFAQAGLPDRGPKSWTELREWGPALLKQKAAGKPVKVTELSGGDSWEFEASVWQFGGRISKGLDVTINQGGAVECADWMRKLIYDDKMAMLASEYGTNFNNGLVGAYMNSTGALAGTYEAAKFHVGVSELPTQVTRGVPTGGGGFSIFKGVPKERKEAAWEVIKFLSSPESAATWSLGTGYLPVVKAAVEQPSYKAALRKDPNRGVAIAQLAHTGNLDEVDAYVQNASPIIFGGLQKIYGDNRPAQGVLDDVADQLKAGEKKIKAQYDKLVGGEE